MDWVGGKLQRHAKANANDQKRAQKQYFAKARQRLQYGQPPVSPPALAHYRASNPQPSSRTSLKATPPSRPTVSEGINLRGPRPPTPGESGPVPANPLEPVKRRLLGKADWAGLSIARPVQMTFPRPTEMHSIGRQKKVQKTQALKATRNTNHQVRLLRAPTLGRVRPVESSLRGIEYSIRMGSNLHQTQTTSRTDSEATFSPNPILTDGKEQYTQRKAPAVEELYLQQDELPEDDHGNLVPLQQIRNLSSFDDVRDRSSSMIRQASDSSNPFLARHGPEQYFSQSRPRSLKSDGVLSEQAGSVNRRREHHSPTLRTQEAVPEKRGLYRGKEAIITGSHSSPHRFTIDDQVLLERQLLSSTTTLPSSRAQSVSLPPVPQEGFADGHEQQTSLRSSYFDSLQHKGPEIQGIGDNERPTKRRRLLGSSNVVHSQTGFAPNRPTQPLPSPGDNTPLSMRDRFAQAKRVYAQGFHSSTRGALAPGNVSNVANKLCDDNEAWMKFVFPKDFNRIQSEFTFQVPPPKQSKPYAVQQSPAPGLLPSRGLVEPAQLSSDSTASIPTDVNASMPGHSRNLVDAQTETDFLSRLSPMEGILEEGYGPISAYTNAARTDRSFTPAAPMMPGSRSMIGLPVDHLASRCPNYRKILHPLSQPRLWHSPKSTGFNTPAKEAIWSATPTRTSSTGVGGLAVPGTMGKSQIHQSTRAPLDQSSDFAQQPITPTALQRPSSRSIDDWLTVNAIGRSITTPSYPDHAFAAPSSQQRRFVRPAM